MDNLPTSFIGRQTQYRQPPTRQQQQQRTNVLDHNSDVYTNAVIGVVDSASSHADVNNTNNITAGDYGLSEPAPTTSTTTITTAAPMSTNKRFKFDDSTAAPIAVTEPVPDEIRINAHSADNEFYINEEEDDLYTNNDNNSDADMDDDDAPADDIAEDAADEGNNQTIAEFIVAASDSEPDELPAVHWPTALTSHTSPPLKHLDTTTSVSITADTPFRIGDTPRIPFSNTNATLQQTQTSLAPNVTTTSVIDSNEIESSGEDISITEIDTTSAQPNKRRKNKNKKRRKNQQHQLQQQNVNNEQLKYYYQRYRLFSKYDSGIKIDAVGWYSVTPERIAAHQAKRCRRYDTIIDAFCGVGGNAIQFALHSRRVIAIDINPVRLACAKHNAKVYGVEDKIDFVLGDYVEMIDRLAGDCVFLSPPWGGPLYSDKDVFDVANNISVAGLNGQQLYQRSQHISEHIVYCLPRNSDVQQIKSMSSLPVISAANDKGYDGQDVNGISNDVKCEIEENYINTKVKMITAYFGEYVDDINGTTESIAE